MSDPRFDPDVLELRLSWKLVADVPRITHPTYALLEKFGRALLFMTGLHDLALCRRHSWGLEVLFKHTNAKRFSGTIIAIAVAVTTRPKII
jgi:hypothetical protein